MGWVFVWGGPPPARFALAKYALEKRAGSASPYTSSNRNVIA